MAAAVSLPRRLLAELVGTAFLVATVIGSGIMGERLASGNTAIALLANAIATGAVLIALILALGPISGAHFNPVVTIAIAVSAKRDGFREVVSYIAAQIAGAFIGVVIAHAMFGEPMFVASTHVRAGYPQFISEVVATFGLLAVIFGCARPRDDGTSRGWLTTPFAVGAYITAAYWFTSSTSFANPAVTMARSVTNTFSGIRPTDVPAFILAQLVGGGAATVLFHWLLRDEKKVDQS